MTICFNDDIGESAITFTRPHRVPLSNVTCLLQATHGSTLGIWCLPTSWLNKSGSRVLLGHADLPVRRPRFLHDP